VGLCAEAYGQDNCGPRRGQEGPSGVDGEDRIAYAKPWCIRVESRLRDYHAHGGSQDGGQRAQGADGADGALNPLHRGVH